MVQHFSRPDRYLARCGRLEAAVTEHRVTGAPAFMRGLRAVFVSDVHVLPGTTREALDALAAKVAALAPELILLGGDYSDDAEGAEAFFDAFGAVHAPMGGYGVIGNNDAEAWAGRIRDLRRVMARAGCKLLVNASARLERNGGRLWIGGVDEYHHGRPDAAGLYPARPEADGYRVLLSHYPIAIEPAPDLMLSGHTHGGQFNLLGITPYTLGFERLPGHRFPSMAVSGLHSVDGMRLLVSKGIGASRIQMRLFVRPEINLLVFE